MVVDRQPTRLWPAGLQQEFLNLLVAVKTGQSGRLRGGPNDTFTDIGTKQLTQVIQWRRQPPRRGDHNPDLGALPHNGLKALAAVRVEAVRGRLKTAQDTVKIEEDQHVFPCGHVVARYRDVGDELAISTFRTHGNSR